MKRIFKSHKIEVLSLDGLRYTTDFDHVESDSSHLPRFDRNHEVYYVHMGEELRKFEINKIVYGFRYYDEEGNQSPYFSAIFCNLENEDSECVILGKYWQNYDADYLNSLSPYSDLPSGWYRCESERPDIFYLSEDDFVKMNSYYPDLVKVDVEFEAYKYDPETYDAIKTTFPIDECYMTPYDWYPHTVRKIIDNKEWFESREDCICSHRRKMIDDKNKCE